MREIKFRFWDDAFDSYVPYPTIENPYIQHPSVAIEQYTGLKDKNGQEIYEGDILKWDNGYKHMVFYTKVEFLTGQFVAVGTMGVSQDIKPMDDGGGSSYKFIVAGNIHENPELLNA